MNTLIVLILSFFIFYSNECALLKEKLKQNTLGTSPSTKSEAEKEETDLSSSTSRKNLNFKNEIPKANSLLLQELENTPDSANAIDPEIHKTYGIVPRKGVDFDFSNSDTPAISLNVTGNVTDVGRNTEETDMCNGSSNISETTNAFANLPSKCKENKTFLDISNSDTGSSEVQKSSLPNAVQFKENGTKSSTNRPLTPTPFILHQNKHKINTISSDSSRIVTPSSFEVTSQNNTHSEEKHTHFSLAKAITPTPYAIPMDSPIKSIITSATLTTTPITPADSNSSQTLFTNEYLGKPTTAFVDNDKPQGSRNAALIVAIFIIVLVCSIIGFVGYKRLHSYWNRRHYSRVDFLIDGLYEM